MAFCTGVDVLISETMMGASQSVNVSIEIDEKLLIGHKTSVKHKDDRLFPFLLCSFWCVSSQDYVRAVSFYGIAVGDKATLILAWRRHE